MTERVEALLSSHGCEITVIVVKHTPHTYTEC